MVCADYGQVLLIATFETFMELWVILVRRGKFPIDLSERLPRSAKPKRKKKSSNFSDSRPVTREGPKGIRTYWNTIKQAFYTCHVPYTSFGNTKSQSLKVWRKAPEEQVMAMCQRLYDRRKVKEWGFSASQRHKAFWSSDVRKGKAT